MLEFTTEDDSWGKLLSRIKVHISLNTIEEITCEVIPEIHKHASQRNATAARNATEARNATCSKEHN